LPAIAAEYSVAIAVSLLWIRWVKWRANHGSVQTHDL